MSDQSSPSEILWTVWADLLETDEGPVTGLAQASRRVDEALRLAVVAQRQAGRSWGDIGSSLGVSRQAAQQRYGHSPGEQGWFATVEEAAASGIMAQASDAEFEAALSRAKAQGNLSRANMIRNLERYTD